MANIARYHRKALPSQNHVEYMSLRSVAVGSALYTDELCEQQCD